MSITSGLEALKEKRYREAVDLLESFSDRHSDKASAEYLQAQMGLVQAYYGLGNLSKAVTLCQSLVHSRVPHVSSWAQATLQSINPTEISIHRPQTQSITATASRAAAGGVKLSMAGRGGNLTLASGVTLSLLFGMVFVLFWGIVLIQNSDNPTAGFGISVVLTLIFNAIVFFLSPWLMDLTQKWLYGTQWVSLADIASRSPETARVIEQVCQQKRIKQPRLGVIQDLNPTAFTYGSLPNSARLVVSEGLFTYLDDEEIATVYAHELGHIVHWDFAVMTIASTLVQICYLIYTFARRLGRGGGNSKAKDVLQVASMVAYIFYLVGTYLVLYLSRTREYFADRFAAETTGNPNALSRALVKIAYGIVEEGKRATEPSRLVEGTRALGIYDHKAAATTGTAYRIASDPQKVGRVFLWDMFNPWGWWMELNSTHPLTGKRVRALSTYAEQLGLATEFDMAMVVREGKTLSKRLLYGNFVGDVLLYSAEIIGIIAGLIAGIIFFDASGGIKAGLVWACPLIGFGIGKLVKTMVMFPKYQNAPDRDVLSLMSDPYASPLRGQPAKLQGELIGRGDAGYAFGSDLKLQDPTGLMYLHYASRFGPIGNFFFGMKRVEGLVGMQVNTLGWFRRGIAPYVDLIQLVSQSGTIVNSYHRFWSFVWGGGAIALGIFLALAA